MKYKWLNLKKNREVIIFFNGWGMDESVIKHLNYGSYDVLMFYDYNTLDTDFDFKSLEKYEKTLKNQGKLVASYVQMWYYMYRSQSGLKEVGLALERQ